MTTDGRGYAGTLPRMDSETRPPGACGDPAGSALSEVERAVLDFAELRWRYTGAKETAIRKQFGWSATRYYQVLSSLLDRPEASVYAPMLVARLRRLAEMRRDQRSWRPQDPDACP